MKKLILPVALVYICMNMYGTNTEFSTIFEARESQLKKAQEKIILKLTEDVELPADLRESLESVDINSFKIETSNEPDSSGNMTANIFCSVSFPAALIFKLLTLLTRMNPASEPLNSTSF